MLIVKVMKIVKIFTFCLIEYQDENNKNREHDFFSKVLFKALRRYYINVGLITK